MTEINDYGGQNPKKWRIFRPVKSGEKVETYGRISTQIPPHWVVYDASRWLI